MALKKSQILIKLLKNLSELFLIYRFNEASNHMVSSAPALGLELVDPIGIMVRNGLHSNWILVGLSGC